MAEHILLEYSSVQDIPTVQEIVEKARSTSRLGIRFSTTFEITDAKFQSTRDTNANIKSRIISELTLLPPNYSVFDSGGQFDEAFRNRKHPLRASIPGISWISMMQVISEEEVLAHANEIVAAAQQFRRLATELVGKLAKTMNVPLKSFANPRFALDYFEGHNPVTPLDSDWTYWLHGYECVFYHTSTGQHIEIVFGFLNEFGVLDPYFFAKFLQSTPEFQTLAQIFQDEYHDARRALEILGKHGRLRRVNGTSYDRVGIAAPLD